MRQIYRGLGVLAGLFMPRNRRVGAVYLPLAVPIVCVASFLCFLAVLACTWWVCSVRPLLPSTGLL